MADTHVELAGSRRPLPRGAVRVRDADSRSHVDLTVTLTGPELPSIDKMPSKTLSREEIDKHWGVPAATVQTVERILKSHGFRVDKVMQGGRSLRVSGTVADVNATFRPNLGVYEVAGEGQIRAREGVLMIPKELDGLITGVYGIDQRRMARRHAAVATATALAPLTPADLESRYNFPPGDGAGRTIAIAEFGQSLGNGRVLPPAYIPADVEQFCASQGLTAPDPKIVSVGITPLTQQQYETYLQQLPQQLANLLFEQTAETMMDVQIIASLCPKADINVYFTTWGEKGWVDLLDEVTSGAGKTPVVLSVSYGLDEQASDWSQGVMASIDHRLQIASMQGITICVSSGDDGTGCGQSDSLCHVEFPSSSQFVLAVGGTMLTGDAGGQVDEVVWWESPGMRTSKGGGSTGGGVSGLNGRPPWQTVHVPSLNPHSIDGRVVPDVSALAGPPLYQLLLDGKPLPDGGTSAATPLWAALIARIDAALPASKQQRFLPPLLYQGTVGKDGFRDVVSGQNASHPQPGKGYKASAGFDAVSGWGVPDGQALLQALAGAAPAAPTVNDGAPAVVRNLRNVAAPAATPLQAAQRPRVQVQCTSCKATTQLDLELQVGQPSPGVVSAIPKADFLVVTWTQAETEAMALVFGGGKYRFKGQDSTNFTPLLFPGIATPEDERYHAHFFPVSVNGKSVLCMKSEFHPKLQAAATTLFFDRLVGPAHDRNVQTVITSGTSGGIWASLDVGDVVVTNTARFGLTGTVEQQAQTFVGLSDITGSNPPQGHATWYDAVNAKILAQDACLKSGLTAQGGRKAASGPPSIHYTPDGTGLTDVVTNSRITDDECGKITQYRTLGATLDENDAYVASALKAVGFTNWISIRNVSDLPCASDSDDQYDRFGYCSSIAGAYAVWAFIMAHQ